MAANAMRMRRLCTPNGSIVMVPLDHGASMGPLPGLEDPAPILQAAAAGGATCVTLHKGLLRQAANAPGHLGVLLHLSAGTDAAADPDDKRLVATVQEAVRLGCDGVSIHINLGSATEARQIEEAGRVSTACQEWGMPLVTMAYARGPKVKEPRDPDLVAHAARLAAELGADAVKVPYTGSVDSFARVVRGCPVPVLVAGGPAQSPSKFLAQMRDARRAGARGASVGRNVFQQKDPASALQAVARIFP